MNINLARLREVQESILDKTCTIKRVSSTSTAGGSTESETTIAAVSCTLGSPSSEAERQIAMKATTQASWILSVPVGTDLHNKDRVYLESKRYQVVHVQDAVSFLTLLRAVVIE
jgi:hypothetical protein